MAKINGLGAVFIKQESKSEALVKWYGEVLELDVSEYGINFLEPNIFTLITFSDSNVSNTKLNFTVDNLEEYMKKLSLKNVGVVSEIKEYPYGKFSSIKDVTGNVVELWEPNYDEYLKMVKNEIEKQKNKR